MKNNSTGLSPAHMLYDQNIALPSAWSTPHKSLDVNESMANRPTFLNTRLTDLRRLGYRKNIKSKQNSSNRYNAKVTPNQSKIGDRVLRHKDVQNSKFSSTWEGPFTVTKVDNKGAFTIIDSSRG
ncbi:hypothetical protein AYI68_g2139 [Smittium mucronatum]|uniref:Uncharacterized protein n=1 Tax=Smittium mucronatum TaxID=133383 RepID=A0A1R0H3M1_9FUNG|nr:hypothetical protein AYI68_g2139 [Smittium mucronatum]